MLENINISKKSTYRVREDVPPSQKLTAIETNEIVDKSNAAIDQINDNSESIDNLEENQYSGVVVFQLYDDMVNYGDLQQNTSYKVANNQNDPTDPDITLNGFYTYNGTGFDKDASGIDDLFKFENSIFDTSEGLAESEKIYAKGMSYVSAYLWAANGVQCIYAYDNDDNEIASYAQDGINTYKLYEFPVDDVYYFKFFTQTAYISNTYVSVKWGEKGTKDALTLGSAAKENQSIITDVLPTGVTSEYSIVGKLIDGILDSTQTSWRTSDFIPIDLLGHKVTGHSYGEGNQVIAFYSDSDEGALLDEKYRQNLPKDAGSSFSDFQYIINQTNAPEGATHFRATTYLNDTIATYVNNGIIGLKVFSEDDYYALKNITKETDDYLYRVDDVNGNLIMAITSEGGLVYQEDSSKIDVTKVGVVLGDTDDYDVIYENTTKINELMQLYKNQNKTLYFPDGVYSLATDIIKMQSGVSVVGQSKANTILKVKGVASSLGSLFGRLNESVSNPLNNVCYKDFTIDESEYILSDYQMWNVNQKAIFTQYITNSQFLNLHLIGSPATALGIDYLSNVLIDGCSGVNCGKYWLSKDDYHYGVGGCAFIGIGTGGYEHENCIITNNISDDAGHFGIFLENQGQAFGGAADLDAKGLIIANNVCRGGKNYGIGVRGGYNSLVANNQCYENKVGGMFYELKLDNVTVLGNNIINNGTSVADEDSYDFEVEAEVGGIDVENNWAIDNLTIKGNVIKDNIGNGIHLHGNVGNSEVSISDNKVIENTLNQLRVSSDTDYMSIHNNRLRGTDAVRIYGTHDSLAFYKNIIFGVIDKTDVAFAGDNTYNEIL